MAFSESGSGVEGAIEWLTPGGEYSEMGTFLLRGSRPAAGEVVGAAIRVFFERVFQAEFPEGGRLAEGERRASIAIVEILKMRER